jgi:energy-coupling factor transport system ATP-binding protein
MSGIPLLRLDSVSFVYMEGTPFETKALDDVSLTVNRSEIVCLIGSTGSGKTTLIQHFNGLLRPKAGKVFLDGEDIHGRSVNLRKIRQRVGLLFQYPEHQLFEETVKLDIAFGPRNMGLTGNELEERVRDSMALVGIPYEKFAHRSPFSLSGGEMRQVALAGILAMRPEILILDEPTSGLDPESRRSLLARIRSFQETMGITVIMVSHSMQELVQVAQRVVVLHRGRLIADGPMKDILARGDLLSRLGFELPPIARLMRLLSEAGFENRTDVFTAREARDEILRLARARK